MYYTTSLAVAGIMISAYAYYIDYMHKRGKYKAVCDINDKASCSKAITSKFGKTFGISNSIGGIIFYSLILILAPTTSHIYIPHLTILAILGSCYLAYILITKLKTFCAICIAIYIVNIAMLITSLLRI